MDMLAEAEQYMMEQAVIAPILFTTTSYMLRDTVSGFTFNPTGMDLDYIFADIAQ